MLMFVYGGVPALLMGIGALFIRNFPITREAHAEVRAKLDARDKEQEMIEAAQVHMHACLLIKMACLLLKMACLLLKIACLFT